MSFRKSPPSIGHKFLYHYLQTPTNVSCRFFLNHKTRKESLSENLRIGLLRSGRISKHSVPQFPIGTSKCLKVNTLIGVDSLRNIFNKYFNIYTNTYPYVLCITYSMRTYTRIPYIHYIRTYRISSYFVCEHKRYYILQCYRPPMVHGQGLVRD